MALPGFVFYVYSKIGTGKKKGDEILKKYYQAFDQVVKVLHAPYKSESLFFRIFRGDEEINEKQYGWDSEKIGKGRNPGNGTWTLKAGKYNNDDIGVYKGDTDIVYTYKDYQPKGSAIKINGTIEDSMYRSKVLFAECIGIYGQTENNPVTDIFTITGAYNATLTFTYIRSKDDDLKITAKNYDAQLFGEKGKIKGLFTELKSKVEFTYAGHTMKLNAKQLKKLLRVAKKNDKKKNIITGSKIRYYYNITVKKFLNI